MEFSAGVVDAIPLVGPIASKVIHGLGMLIDVVEKLHGVREQAESLVRQQSSCQAIFVEADEQLSKVTSLMWTLLTERQRELNGRSCLDHLFEELDM